MAEKIIMPQGGQDITEGKVVKWLKAEGDPVQKGEIVCEVETEKVVFEVESPVDGVLLKIIVPEGEKTAIFSVIGIVGKPGEEIDLDKFLAEEKKEEKVVDVSEIRRKLRERETSATGKIKASGRARRLATEKGIDLAAIKGTGPGGRIVEEDVIRISKETGKAEVSEAAFAEEEKKQVRVSPVARKIAEESGIQLATIKGTGPAGRILKADVFQAVEEKKRRATMAGRTAAKASEQVKEVLEEIPIRGVRRVIFDNMYQSLSQSAQLTLHTEASAESLIDLRERFIKDEQKISYNAILLKIVAMALRRHPKINASVEGDTIRVWKQIHIGLAMETNEALMVPVVRNPDLRTFREIDRDISDLIQRARENRLSPDDLVNGTFTITNLGFADIDNFTPIIRPPESAILGVGRIVKKPSIRDDQVVPEARIALSLTFDHRIIDGAPGARFLRTIKKMIEDPLMMVS